MREKVGKKKRKERKEKRKMLQESKLGPAFCVLALTVVLSPQAMLHIL